MRKLLYIAITFFVCALFNAGHIWAGFTLAFCLLSFKTAGSSILWEIPMGVLACSILNDVFADETVGILRILIPIAAVLLAGLSPRRLMIFFPLAIASLYFKNIYALAAMCAALWCSVRLILVDSRRKNNSTTKGSLLQGNNFSYEKNNLNLS